MRLDSRATAAILPPDMHRLAASASSLLFGLALVPALALAQQPAPQAPQPAQQAQPQTAQQAAPEAPAQQAVPAPRIVLPVVVIALPAPLVTPAVSMAIRDAIVAGLAPAAGGRPVVALPDEDKGERLVAVTNEPKLQLEDLRAVIKAKGFSNLCVPRELRAVREIPKLGTGKVNHRELVTQLQAAETPAT